MLRAGDLRHRVTIQQKTVTRDDYGAEVETWRNLATVWAEVMDLSGREFFSAQQMQSDVTTRVCVRYRSDIAPDMRVVCGTRLLDIKAPLDPDGKRRELHLMCREVR